MKKMESAQLYWLFVSLSDVAKPSTLAFPMLALRVRQTHENEKSAIYMIAGTYLSI